MRTIAALFDFIPPDVNRFALVVIFSLLIGLEQRRHFINEAAESIFGTDRTFTLIGILGFILYVLEPSMLGPFLGGGLVLGILLAIYYFQKIQIQKRFGITSLVTALITYCLAPLIYTQPAWLVLLVVVAVLILTEIKETLSAFSKRFDHGEFITLAKFLVIAGVILPLLPEEVISKEINVSPYQFWLAIVAVSCISYLSYLLKKFVFPDSGIVLTGILGGLYSSTATTFILARKSRQMEDPHKASAAILLATTMMYLRILLLAVLLNVGLAKILAPYFATLIVLSSLIALYLLRVKTASTGVDRDFKSHDNPLEFKTALVFALLFIFFAVLTGYVNEHFGTRGIQVLSFVVGVTDIDPFILNLFQTKILIAPATLVVAVLNATTSNNLLKLIYALSLANPTIRKQLIAGFGLLIVAGLVFSFFIHF